MENAPPCAGRPWPPAECLFVDGLAGTLDQAGLEDYVVCGDSADAESLKQITPVEEGEEVEGRLVPKSGAGVAVDMAERLVELALVEVVEGSALGADEAQELVVALHMALLPGGTGVTVEETRAPLSVRRGLDGGGVGELTAVVGEQHGKELAEAVGADPVLEHTEGIDHRLRVVAFTQEREHQAAGDELHGE